MRRGLLLLAAVAGALLHGTAVHANDPWYVSGSVGGYFREAQNNTASFDKTYNPNIAATGTEHQAFDPGAVGNLALGYRVIPEIRVEAEIGYIGYTGNAITPFTADLRFPELKGSTLPRLSGDEWSRFTGTVNAFYDFGPIMGLFPYIGGGVGGSANHRTSGFFLEPNGGTFHTNGGSSTEGFALLEAGVTIPITESLSIVPAYRFIHFFAGNEDVAHAVKIGLRYTF